MDKTSFFIKNRALFGSYPSQDAVKELEQNGVRYFVNLTCPDEKFIEPYTTQYTKIDYPIVDKGIPTDIISFCRLIVYCGNVIRNLPSNLRLFINCRGGHSRSALLVVCILCHLFSIPVSEALDYTTRCHGSRSVLRDKWRKIKVPQSYIQKKFVHQLFKQIHLQKMARGVFNMNAIGNFNLPDLSLNVSSLSEGYVTIQKIFQTEYERFRVIFPTIEEWSEEDILKYLVNEKIKAVPEYKNLLLRTYLRPIQSYNFNDHTSMILSKILMHIRVDLLLSLD